MTFGQVHDAAWCNKLSPDFLCTMALKRGQEEKTNIKKKTITW